VEQATRTAGSNSKPRAWAVVGSMLPDAIVGPQVCSDSKWQSASPLGLLRFLKTSGAVCVKGSRAQPSGKICAPTLA